MLESIRPLQIFERQSRTRESTDPESDRWIVLAVIEPFGGRVRERFLLAL